jgi:hypothetical protein
MTKQEIHISFYLVHLKDAGTYGKVTLKWKLAELSMEKEFVMMNPTAGNFWNN